jgi:hypothetical protein
MTGLTALVLPILLSAVFVFVASSIIHMFTPWHKGDYGALPNEDQARAALRQLSLPPGEYMVPRPGSREEMRSGAHIQKMKEGPVMMISVWAPGAPSMGRSFVLWFVYCAVVALFAGYVAGRALGPGAEYLHVFRFVGATAFLAYAGALWQATIWFRRSWLTTFRSTVDGLIYALLTAGTFGWLWPR